jgi:cell wall-associated NlpC family hydrolase
MFSILAVVAVCLGTVTSSSHLASASTLGTDRARANQLLKQINRISARVDYLGQKYDLAKIKLDKIASEITNTKADVKIIKKDVSKGDSQLRAEAIFAYVTNGSAASNNPLFSNSASKIGATNVYNQLAQGDVAATLSNLKNYKIELTQERSLLASEVGRAASLTRAAAKSFHSANVYQSSLNHALAQVKGSIATYIAQAEAAASAKEVTSFNAQSLSDGITNPPPDSRANIAIRTAMSYIGTWYVWGGASKSGVDCSGLIMLAYEAAGIDFPHYSGAMYEDTERVPLVDIEPGDLLFYGYDGDQHVAMYVGDGKMIEAEMTGTRVHVVPVRLGYGFFGLGRPRG